MYHSNLYSISCYALLSESAYANFWNSNTNSLIKDKKEVAESLKKGMATWLKRENMFLPYVEQNLKRKKIDVQRFVI